MAGGPDAVRIQPIASELGITDAAIHHHFGSRDELLTELLRFGGRRLREALADATAKGTEGGLDLDAFVTAASRVFSDKGYSRLAIWLTAKGWRQQGSGVFDELAAGICGVPLDDAPPARAEQARRLAALLAMILMAEPIFGDAARRSVSLPSDATNTKRFKAWVTQTFESLVSRDFR
jgi:AcrR family transcriptional regulator